MLRDGMLFTHSLEVELKSQNAACLLLVTNDGLVQIGFLIREIYLSFRVMEEERAKRAIPARAFCFFV